MAGMLVQSIFTSGRPTRDRVLSISAAIRSINNANRASSRWPSSILPNIEPHIQVKLPSDMFFYSKNLIFNLQQITFHKTGQYSIDLLLNDAMIARISLLMRSMIGRGVPAGAAIA